MICYLHLISFKYHLNSIIYMQQAHTHTFKEKVKLKIEKKVGK